MLLTPSIKTELYTHYAFLPRCVPVPCEFRGDDTRWNCFNCINLIWDLVFLPASWNESDLHRDQHWQNIQCQAKDIMSPTLSRNVMWWKYICNSSPLQVSREAQNSQRLSSQTFSTFFCRWMKRWDMYEMYIDMYFSLKSSLT